MKIINGNQIVIEHDIEINSLKTMLEDLPYYLGLDAINLSAISEYNRKELLQLIKIIEAKQYIKRSDSE